MREDVADERAQLGRVAFRLDFDDIVADVAHEAVQVITQRYPANRFTEEHALHEAPDLDVSTLLAELRFAVAASLTQSATLRNRGFVL